jgi:60 kDa SS-A/Ro ribonucleoprotein
MDKYLKLAQIGKPTPQSKPLPGREAEMELNPNAGYTFRIDDWRRLTRFLILGTTSGSFYFTASDLTGQNVDAIIKCIQLDGKRVVDEIVRVADNGLAPKQSPAIFALALVATHGDVEARQYAFAKLNVVCRTASHLFEFIETLDTTRSWGRGFRRAVANWYNLRSTESLAYQIIKYRKRNNWTHRDALRQAHVKPATPEHDELYGWVTGKNEIKITNFALIEAFEKAQKPDATTSEIAKLIIDYRLPREAIPNRFLSEIAIWEALLNDMPYTALMRNLPKLTQIELIKPFGDWAKRIAAQLTDLERLKKAHVHPLSILTALGSYQRGYGLGAMRRKQGGLRWTPNADIVAALNDAFLNSYQFVEPIHENILVAVDASGSMSGRTSIDFEALYVGAAIALYYVHANKNAHVIAYDTNVHAVNIRRGVSVEEAYQELKKMGGGTDASLPVKYAMSQKLKNLDGILQITDNISWAGDRHASEALMNIRDKFARDIRLVNLAMTANRATIVDPRHESFAMEMAGFDASAPQIANLFFSKML